jgi:hypothetical protein
MSGQHSAAWRIMLDASMSPLLLSANLGGERLAAPHAIAK